MQLTAVPSAKSSKVDVFVVAVFDDELGSKKKSSRVLQEFDEVFDGLLISAATKEGFKGKGDQGWAFHTHGKLPADSVVLVGLGARSRLSPEAVRVASGRGAKVAARLKAKTVRVFLPDEQIGEREIQAASEGFVMGSYKFDRYRTSSKEDKSAPGLTSVEFVTVAAKEKTAKEALALGTRVGEAVNWARDLVNEPAGVMTPTRLADEAKACAKEAGLKITVGSRADIQKLKMGMFLGVAQGSAEEPRLIRLSYVPSNPKAAKEAPVALVGKAITFDSGGLSLKTAEGMVDMKTDMAGSAAVLGAMRVIGTLKPPFPVTAYIGACENMPSGTAYRPGDILISRLGKTVEITNTDAEGRLVLGDILAWANEDKPSAIIDLATLTGACMIALGHYIVGAFADDDSLIGEVLGASEVAGEQLWRLPIADVKKEALRSEVADMKNSGERYGGALNAAGFLREFVGETPWVHLDIAGPSQSPKERSYYIKGATGVGVRTLVEFVRRRASGEKAAQPSKAMVA
jgi:leucyl aminopeptidase